MAFVGVLVAVAIAYLIGFGYFSSHFMPRTTVAGIDASWLSAAELASRLERRVQGLSDHVSGEGLDFTVTASEVSLRIDGLASAEDALAQSNAASWPASFFSPQEIEPELGVTLDERALATKVTEVTDTYNSSTADYDENATIVYDEDQDKFVSTVELANSKLDADAVSRRVSQDLRSLKEETVIDASALMLPTLTDEDRRLIGEADRANRMLALDIPLTLNGEVLMQIDRDLIINWISVAEGAQGPEATVSAETVAAWSYENLNEVVNGENETRTWEVDSPATGEALASKINALDSSQLEVPTITLEERPPESEGASLRGRHIDVNISTQYARLYDEDGQVIWRSPIVTGDPSLDQDTPIGDFNILDMEEETTLEGADEDGDGEPDYETFVYYWMCFEGQSYGLHDATWRSEDEFGGSTYASEGSHGCVNLPYDKAAELYGLIHLGDAVHIHF